MAGLSACPTEHDYLIIRYGVDGLPCAGISTLLTDFEEQYLQLQNLPSVLQFDTASSALKPPLNHVPHYVLKFQIFARILPNLANDGGVKDVDILARHRGGGRSQAAAIDVSNHLDNLMRKLLQHFEGEGDFISRRSGVIAADTQALVLLYDTTPLFYLHTNLQLLVTR